jgi:transposase
VVRASGGRIVALGEERGQAQTLQVEMVCLDELVPADDRYRRLDGLLEWGFVRELAAPYYAEVVGRPSIDPIVLVKLMLAGAMEGIGSMRELLRVAALRLDLRRFLGYGFSERLPAHQTLSHAHTVRFVDDQLFERLFLRSVALCCQHGLLDGTHLSVDGFHVEADAALASLRASLKPAAGPEGDRRSLHPEGAPQAPSAQLALAEPRSGPTPRRTSSNRTAVSSTDPEARLRGKPGQRPHLVHRGQVAVDPRARCVVACLGERADGYEGDALAEIADRARFCCPELASVGADQGYAASRVWRAMARRGIVAFVPPQRRMLPPDGEAKTEAQREAQAARKRCQSAHGIWAHRRRMADSEGAIAELKDRHALDRARRRGTRAFHVQLLLGCTALNMKRLATRVGQDSEGWAAGLGSGAAASVGLVAGVSTDRHAIRWRSIDLLSTPNGPHRPVTVAVWAFSVSLN